MDVCRELYNAALQERRDAYQINALSIDYHAQAVQLPLIKQVREDVGEIYSQVLQDALRRVDKAFDAFFRRCQNGETPGYPRFKSASRYDSFTYQQSGFRLEGDNRLFGTAKKLGPFGNRRASRRCPERQGCLRRKRTLSFYERGGDIPAGLAPQMAWALGVSVDELFGELGKKKIVSAGPTSRMRHLFKGASKLPRSQQEKIAAVLEAFVNQRSDHSWISAGRNSSLIIMSSVYTKFLTRSLGAAFSPAATPKNPEE